MLLLLLMRLLLCTEFYEMLFNSKKMQAKYFQLQIKCHNIISIKFTIAGCDIFTQEIIIFVTFKSICNQPFFNQATRVKCKFISYSNVKLTKFLSQAFLLMLSRKTLIYIKLYLFCNFLLISVLQLQQFFYSLHWDAAAHQGAVSWCHGCRRQLQFLNLYTY